MGRGGLPRVVSRGLPALACALTALPALLLVARIEIDVPWMDQWSLVGLFSRVAEGEADARDFFTPHNRVHQIALARALHVLLAFASDWNMKLELFTNLAWIGLGYAVLCRLALAPLRDAPDAQRGAVHVANVLSGMLCFSLSQYRLMSWGWATQDVVAVALSICAIGLLRPGPRSNAMLRLGLAALCCLAASFAKTTGLAAWPALLPSLLALASTRGRWLAPLLLWLAAALVTVLLLALAAAEPGSSGRPLADFAPLWRAPLRTLSYFGSLLGIPLGFFAARAGSWSVATAALAPIGLLCLALYLALAYASLRAHGRDRDARSELRRMAAPWLSLGLFSLVYAAINTAGRSPASELWGPLTPSYISMYGANTAPLAVAVIQLAALLQHAAGRATQTRSESARARSAWGHAFPALALTAALALLASQWRALGVMAPLIERRDEQAPCLALRAELAHPSACLPGILPQHASELDALERLGFLAPAAEVEWREDAAGAVEGAVDPELVAPRSGDALGLFSARGWALLAGRDTAPPWLVLAREGEHAIFAPARTGLPSPALAEARQSRRYARAGWHARLPAALLDQPGEALRAWAFEPLARRFVPLEGRLRTPDTSPPASEPTQGGERLHRLFEQQRARRDGA